MKKRMTPETDFPDLWDLRGYWGACFIQVDSDGDGISDAAEEYYEEHPEEWEERNEFLESQGMGTRDYDDYIGEDSDGPETPEGATTGGGDPGDPGDPNVNEYGYNHGDWDGMSQNERRDIAHSHGDTWHGQAPPSADDDDGAGATSSTSSSSSPEPVRPDFKTGAEREDWLAEQRQRLYDEQEQEYQENIDRGHNEWAQQTQDHADAMREEGREDAADRLEQMIAEQRAEWDREGTDSTEDRDQRRAAYIDRPTFGRETRIQQYQDADGNVDRRQMRSAIAQNHPQMSAQDIEYSLWYNWAWEDAPPPPSAARIPAATGPNAAPPFSESLDPMLKLGWETGEEYLERVEILQAERDQLSRERALRESREGQSTLDRSLEQLNAMGLGPAEYAVELERLAQDPWFHGVAYDDERRWLAGTADFYRSVGTAIAIGQPGTAGDLGEAISALQQISGQADITEAQRAYLGRVIDSHTEARTPLVEASEKAIDAWVTKVLGNINAFGGEEALGRAQGIQNDRSLTPDQRQQALADLEFESWETKALGNISAFGGPEALAQAQAVQDDGSLTPEQRQKALANLQAETWETKVMGNIGAFGGPEALAQAQAVQDDGLTREARWEAMSDLETRVIDQAEAKYDQEMQEARDLAVSLGWDPDARGGRPELTPLEYIQRHNRDLAKSLGWDPDARGGRPELTPWEYIEQHNEEVEARARNWRESQRQVEALDELEPERLAHETLQRQQAAQFREDMFAELRSRGVAMRSWP